MNGTAAQIATAEQIIAERIAQIEEYEQLVDPEFGTKRPGAARLVGAPPADYPLVREWLAHLTGTDIQAARIIGWFGRQTMGYAYMEAPKSYAAWKASR